jgi:hypothetical protein
MKKSVETNGVTRLAGGTFRLGGQFKTGNLWTGQNRQFAGAAETALFYFVPSSVRKSGWTFVRQLRGPHFSSLPIFRSSSSRQRWIWSIKAICSVPPQHLLNLRTSTGSSSMQRRMMSSRIHHANSLVPSNGSCRLSRFCSDPLTLKSLRSCCYAMSWRSYVVRSIDRRFVRATDGSW